MDIRDFSVARSYAKDIIIAEMEQEKVPSTDEEWDALIVKWDKLSDATLHWYAAKLRQLQAARKK